MLKASIITFQKNFLKHRITEPHTLTPELLNLNVNLNLAQKPKSLTPLQEPS